MSPGGTGRGHGPVMAELDHGDHGTGSLFFKGIERTCSMVWPFYFCGFILFIHFQLLTGVKQPQKL